MAKKDFMSMMKEKTVDVRPSLLSAEESIKQQIIVLDELRDLIPPLTAEELKQLEQNMLTHGVKDPLTIWETTVAKAELGIEEIPAFVLIDGHNRYSFIKEHQLDFRINLVRFASLAEVKEYMIDYQLGRRNLTPEQASYLRGMRYNQLKAMRGSNLLSDAPQMNVAQKLATEYGVSSRTIKRDGNFAAGLEKLAPALKKEVLTRKQKLSKSTVSGLSKAEGISDIATIDQLNEQTTTVSTVETDTIDALQKEIRELASGLLDKKACAKLIQKATALIALHSA